MKKYQPERTDLVINTEWGIPKDEVPADEARQRGLVLFEDRWVSADERKSLKRQRFTYRAIRVVAAVVCLFAGHSAYALLLNISRKAPVGAVVMLGILACAYVAAAVGLYVFRRWAYYVAMVLIVISVVQNFVARKFLFLAIAVLLVLFLIRKPVRRIFSPPKGATGPL